MFFIVKKGSFTRGREIFRTYNRSVNTVIREPNEYKVAQNFGDFPSRSDIGGFGISFKNRKQHLRKANHILTKLEKKIEGVKKEGMGHK